MPTRRVVVQERGGLWRLSGGRKADRIEARSDD